VTECLLRYAEAHGPEVVSRRTLGYATLRLGDWWEGRTCAEVGPESADQYRAWRQTPPADGRKPVKASTVDRELTVLRAALHHAFQAGELTRLPPMPKMADRPGRDHALTETECDRLLAAADAATPHLRLFTYLALFSAGRAGALLELTWDQIDLGERPRLRLNPDGREQTAKGRAVIPIPHRLVSVLQEARAAAEQAGTLDLPLIHWRRRAVKSVRKGFRSLVLAAGLPVAGRKRVTPHVLRHTAATLMAVRGVPLAQIAQWLGQRIERTTERYIQWTPEYLEQARAALDREPLRPRLVASGGAVLGLVAERGDANGGGTPP